MTRLLAVDGGGSKVDAALLDHSGAVLGAGRWWGPFSGGLDLDDPHGGSLNGLSAIVQAVCRDAGAPWDRGPIAQLGVYCLAGADLPADVRRLSSLLDHWGWTDRCVVHNDTFAVLRAGSERRWGVAVVCGHGTNCSGVAPDGRTLRFPAVGYISGDWGGGLDIGRDAFWFAVRSEDGRGDPTALAEEIPAHFGMRRPRELVEAFYFGRLNELRLGELAPLVFACAKKGDGVAQRIVDRQADEIIAMAGTAIRRLHLADTDLDVVLGGGIFRNHDMTFLARITEGLRTIAPGLRMIVLEAPPVLGAALLGLDLLKGDRSAALTARTSLTHERLAGNAVGVVRG